MENILISNIPMPKHKTFRIEIYPNGNCLVDDGGIVPVSANAHELPSTKLGFVSLDNVLDKLDERIKCYKSMNYSDGCAEIQNLVHIQSDMLSLKSYK